MSSFIVSCPTHPRLELPTTVSLPYMTIVVEWVVNKQYFILLSVLCSKCLHLWRYQVQKNNFCCTLYRYCMMYYMYVIRVAFTLSSEASRSKAHLYVSVVRLGCGIINILQTMTQQLIVVPLGFHVSFFFRKCFEPIKSDILLLLSH